LTQDTSNFELVLFLTASATCPRLLPAQPLVFATARNLPEVRGNIPKRTKRPLGWQRCANTTDGNLDESYTAWIGEEPTMGK
jgi:hypothetical protein